MLSTSRFVKKVSNFTHKSGVRNFGVDTLRKRLTELIPEKQASLADLKKKFGG
jgi:hypothetical protein